MRFYKMRILVGHERFGRLRDALRKLGHEAWSCDKISDVHDNNRFHIKDDVMRHLDDGWDAAIFFPDCTYLTVAAAWAYGDGPYHMKIGPDVLVGKARRAARNKAIRHVECLLKANIEKIAVENPASSFLSKAIRPADQIIHPYMFGHSASKATGLWLKNLPKLKPTRIIKPAYFHKGLPRWNNQAPCGAPKAAYTPTRAIERAATFPGIANAMAKQWFGKAM